MTQWFRMNGNLVHLLVFTQYLVSQYISSPIMNHAILFWDGIIVKLLNDPRCPPAVKMVDQKVREYLQKLIGFTSQYVRPQPVAAQQTRPPQRKH